MAYVSIRWGTQADHHLNYVAKDRGPDDVASANDCFLETANDNFASVRRLHGKEGGNQCLHLVQSFSPADSIKLEPEEYHAIGCKLAEANFPGHQYVIRTHTDQGHIHNHIVLNTVHTENGRKIENKRALIAQLRTSSDNFCREQGLSIIQKEANERKAKLPFRVQQMIRAGKKPYLLDLVQKADLARTYATNYGEYQSLLSEFKIRTVIEPKNISYFYPGREKGKRGSKLGRFYDKPGLEETFKSNLEKYAKQPELRTLIRSQLDTVREHGVPALPASISKFAQPWDGSGRVPEGLSSHRQGTRRNRELSYASDQELLRSFAPIVEIRRARERSIPDYCKRNGIGLSTNDRGETVLTGKPFVVVGNNEYKNTNNGTKGSLIDLVAAHKKLTLLQAVAHINENPRLLLLEGALGEVKRTYTSFCVPVTKRASASFEAAKIASFLQSLGAPKELGESLSKRRLVHVDETGHLRLFSKEDASGALEYTEGATGTWSRKTHGRARTPVHSVSGKGSKAILFLDPEPLFKKMGLDLLSDRKRDTGVLGLLQPDEKLVHQFMAENRHVRSLFVALSGEQNPPQAELDLFHNLKSKYRAHGITVELFSPEKERELERERRSRDLGPSL